LALFNWENEGFIAQLLLFPSAIARFNEMLINAAKKFEFINLLNIPQTKF